MAIASGASACPVLAAECWKPSFRPEGAAAPLIQKLVTNRRVAELQPAATMIPLSSAMLAATGNRKSAAASRPSVSPASRLGMVTSLSAVSTNGTDLRL